MLFGRLLTNGKAFGKNISTGAKAFGRNLTATAHKISYGIGEAEQKLSKIEKHVANVPILGSGLKTIGGIMEGAKNIADMTAGGGQALTDVARGDFGSAKGDFKNVVGSFKGAVNAGKSVLTSGASTVAGGAMLI